MFLRHNYLGLLWALLMLVLSGIPGSKFEKTAIDHIDLLIHAFMYGLLFLLLTVGFIKQRTFKGLGRGTTWKVAIIASLYGVLLEVLQYAVFIERSFELSDIAFNLIGVMSGWMMFRLIYGKDAST